MQSVINNFHSNEKELLAVGNSNDSSPIHVPVFSGLCIHAGGEESVWNWGGAEGVGGPLLCVQLRRERGSYFIIRGGLNHRKKSSSMKGRAENWS